MSSYSLLFNIDDSRKVWKKLTNGQRYPARYLRTDYLIENTSWYVRCLIDLLSRLTHCGEDIEEVGISHKLSDVVVKAKEIIAEVADVGTDQVEIKINS